MAAEQIMLDAININRFMICLRFIEIPSFVELKGAI
jgi:hypothetical protein